MSSPYDPIAPQFDALRRGFHSKESHYLDLLLADAPAGSTVLDLGCGTGRPFAQAVAARGFKVVGVDRSRPLLDLARAYVPGGVWAEADLLTVELDGPFSAVICWDAMFHLPRIHHRAVIEKMYRWLEPGGRMMLSSGGAAADNPAFTDTMFGHTFFYDAHPMAETIRLVKDVGFEILLAELASPPDGDRDKGKLAIVAAK